MARLALALLALSAHALRPTTRVARAPTQRNLFGGAPPEEDTPASPPPGQGGQTMSVPGLGDITEEEMKLAMEFRQKMAQSHGIDDGINPSSSSSSNFSCFSSGFVP